LGAVGNAIARGHVLLLGARRQTKWSGGRGRHSEPLVGDLVRRREPDEGRFVNLLANSGCFVSKCKCVLWCFVVFCGCFVMFCGCFAVFCECFGRFAVFPQNTQNTKHPKNIKKRKTLENTKNSQYARVLVLRAFSKSQEFRLYCTKHFSQNICKTLQNSAKRKTPQNSHKTRFVKLRRKTPQNKRKTLKTVTKRSQYSRNTYCAHSVLLFKNTLDLSRKHTMRNTQYTRKLQGGGHVPAGGHVAGLWMFFKNSVLRCFAVFCGVLRCFVCVFLAFFTRQHKTDQKVYKTHKTNKIHFVQYSAIRCCASFSHALRKCLQKTFAKHVQNIAKHPQNTAKHCTVFLKTLAKHHKTPAKHPPQNTAKHRKTPQNTFANKTDRIS